MRSFILALLLVVSIAADAQIRLKLNYNERWELTTPDSAKFIRVAIYDTTNSYFAGPVVDLYLNGKPQMKGFYKNQKKEGEFTFYYEDGSVESTGNFVNDTRKGTWIYSYSNGQPKAEVQFPDSLSERILSWYDSTGTLTVTNGTGKWEETFVHGSDSISATREVRNYKKEGTWRVFNPKSGDYSEDIYKDGVYQTTHDKIGKRTMTIKRKVPLLFPVPVKFIFTEVFAASKSAADPATYFKLYPSLKMIMFGKSPVTKYDLNSEIIYGVEEVDISPKPINSEPRLYVKYLFANLKYPKEARQNKVKGQVYIEFIINKDGTTSDFAVFKGIGSGCDEEALRVVKGYYQDKKWEPITKDGKSVRVRFVIAVLFPLTTKK